MIRQDGIIFVRIGTLSFLCNNDKSNHNRNDNNINNNNNNSYNNIFSNRKDDNDDVDDDGDDNDDNKLINVSITCPVRRVKAYIHRQL